MRIAVTFLAGQVFGHFGKAKEFAVFDIENSRVVANRLLPVSSCDSGVLFDQLKKNNIDLVICGEIENDAHNALNELGIECIAGVQGNVRHAVEEYLMGTLLDNPVKYCGHQH